MNRLKCQEKIKSFLLEDLGEGNRFTAFEKKACGRWIAGADGIVAGIDVIQWGLALLDPHVCVNPLRKDGEKIGAGETLATATGSAEALLAAERVLLNLLQRMCGIATITDQAVARLRGSSTLLTDTRKTAPGLRMFDKYAVRCGGGKNHRFGLYDAVMIKDNHIALYGSITNAVRAARKQIGPMVKIEVECETQQHVEEACLAQVDAVLFDNCSASDVQKWAGIVPDGITTEASGNMTLKKLSEYKNCGVDYISCGFLTHSAAALDIRFEMERT